MELTSVCRQLERRGSLTAGNVDVAMTALWTLPVDFYWNDDWVETALRTARQHGLPTVYDAVFLACGEYFDARFVTCDGTFCRSFGDQLPERVQLIEEIES